MGKNNFDRLEAASLMGSPTPDADQVKARLETRIHRLTDIHAQLQAMRLELSKLPVTSSKKGQMRLLTAAMDTTSNLFNGKDFKLPTGTKQPLKRCLNELTSLREGVYIGATISTKTMKLITCKTAEKDIEALLVTAKNRLIQIEADTFDMQKLYDDAHDVIKKNADEVNKLKSIKDKPFVLARVPVVPVSDGISIPKLQNSGFSVQNLAGYPSIDKQLVLGINPKLSFTDLGQKTVKDADGNSVKQNRKAGELNNTKTRDMLHKEAVKLVKMLEKQLKTKLFFVSAEPFAKLSGSWFWLMTENDMNRFKKAFPSTKQKIASWGFSFN